MTLRECGVNAAVTLCMNARRSILRLPMIHAACQHSHPTPPRSPPRAVPGRRVSRLQESRFPEQGPLDPLVCRGRKTWSFHPPRFGSLRCMSKASARARRALSLACFISASSCSILRRAELLNRRHPWCLQARSLGQSRQQGKNIFRSPLRCVFI